MFSDQWSEMQFIFSFIWSNFWPFCFVFSPSLFISAFCICWNNQFLLCCVKTVLHAFNTICSFSLMFVPVCLIPSNVFDVLINFLPACIFPDTDFLILHLHFKINDGYNPENDLESSSLFFFSHPIVPPVLFHFLFPPSISTFHFLSRFVSFNLSTFNIQSYYS